MESQLDIISNIENDIFMLNEEIDFHANIIEYLNTQHTADTGLLKQEIISQNNNIRILKNEILKKQYEIEDYRILYNWV